MPCDDCSRQESCPPCINEQAMSYRDVKRQIFAELDDPESEAWLGSWLDVFARKLAEMQRAWLIAHGYNGPCVCESCSWCLAQDFIRLIDPEAHGV